MRKLQMILNIVLIIIALILYNYSELSIYSILMEICYLIIIMTNLIAIYSEIKNTYPKINIISILSKSFVVLIITFLAIK